jgi:hypothetical protein
MRADVAARSAADKVAYESRLAAENKEKRDRLQGTGAY